MKTTKNQTRQVKQEREFKCAMQDCKSEFGIVMVDLDILDEVEMAEVVDYDE